MNQQGYSNDATDDKVVEIAKACLLKIFLNRRQRMMNDENENETQQNMSNSSNSSNSFNSSNSNSSNSISSSSFLPALPLIDTCIFHIYASMKVFNSTTEVSPLEKFVSNTTNCLSMEDVTGVLQRKSLFHVLALLNACKGRKRQALEIWMRIGNVRSKFEKIKM